MGNNNIKLGIELKMTLQAFDRRVERSHFGLLHPELKGKNMFILNYLYKNVDEDIYQKDIERIFNIHKSSVSDILSNLESHGYIVRKSEGTDGRYKKIVINDKGKEMCAEFKKELNKIESELQTKLSVEEINEIVLNLEKIRKCLEGE